MALTGFASVGGVVLGDAPLFAAGEQLVNDGQNTIGEVATAGENAPAADAGRELPGFTDSFINSVLTHANLTDSKAQEILNQTDITRDDLTGVAAILDRVSDDWQDNNFDTTRDNRATTPAEELGANEFAQLFRPVWTDTGDATISASGGQLTISGGTINGGEAKTPSLTLDTDVLGAIGDWQCQFSFTSDIDGNAGADNPVIMMPLLNDVDNNYHIRVATGGPNIQLIRRLNGGDSAQISTGGTTIGTATHTVRVTIDINGDLEFFYDGVSQGTTNDDRMAKFGSTGFAGSGADTDIEYDWWHMRSI